MSSEAHFQWTALADPHRLSEMAWIGAPELWVRGGWVMPPLYILGALAWIFVIAKAVELYQWRRELAAHRAGQSLEGMPGLFAQATRDLQKRGGTEGHFAAEQWEWELVVGHALQSKIGTIGRIASVAPLIGLLGTVAGLITTFDALHMNSMVNAQKLSEGVSEALVATQSGLLTAFPLMLAHQQLTSWAERLEQWGMAEWTRMRRPDESEETT